jgi:hypothetical protein
LISPEMLRRHGDGFISTPSQLVNALFGGYPDETISFRSATARDQGKRWGCVLCKLLHDPHGSLHAVFEIEEGLAATQGDSVVQ